jgi:endonuclease/exonuclease/phosphatase (EEP) superfamily protein YafD
MELPGARRVVLANVRLVLPSVVQAVASLRWPTDLASGHRGRARQFVELADLLEATLRQQRTRSLILAGDFNTPGGLPSLFPLTRVASDVWPRRGLGWGGTMTAELPVSRIDQCWVSADIEPVAARVQRGEGSDHRLLVVDLIVR